MGRMYIKSKWRPTGGSGAETDVDSEGRRPDCGRDTLRIPLGRGEAAAPAGVVGGLIVRLCDECTAPG